MNQNVVPRPGSLSTPIAPPMASQRRLEIASPRPVPPYRRVVEASACENGWNSLGCAAAGMPMPVSVTSKRRTVAVPSRADRLTRTETLALAA